MGILQKIRKIWGSTLVFDVISEDDSFDGMPERINPESSKEGYEFEKYVRTLFDPQYFAVVYWTKDISRKHDGTNVESDWYPDFTIHYLPSNQKFSLGCKFRSRFLPDREIRWTYPQRLDQYYLCSIQEEMPVFVVIGLGGKPQKPEKMFCLPLEEAKYPVLFPTVFNKHERPPNKMFFWRDSTLY